MSIEIQYMTEKLIVITIKLDYSKVAYRVKVVPTYANTLKLIDCCAISKAPAGDTIS